MPGFKEWLREKTEEAQHSERALRRQEWLDAYQRLVDEIGDWLRDDALDGRIEIRRYPVERIEQGLGAYELPALKIGIGDASVDLVPVGRNVVGRLSPRSESGPRVEGRVDITGGAHKYALYRTMEGGQDRWHVVDERNTVSPLSHERLQEILMDLMS